MVLTKSILKMLKEASAATDMGYHSEAQEAFRLFVQAVKAGKLIDNSRFPNQNQFKWLYGDDIDPKYSDLTIVLFDADALDGGDITKKFGVNFDGEGSFATKGNEGYIGFMSVEDGNPLKRLNRSVFVHEFIHYLDFVRSGKKLRTRDGYSDDDGGYYNDASELNAFYHTGLSHLQGFFKQGLGDRIPKDTFKDFYGFCLEYVFDSDFIKNLTQDNKRKFQTRLYGYWKETFNSGQP